MSKALLPTALLLLSGCATSTAPGAVGVSRPQLMIVPSAAINAQAAEGYAKLSSQAGAQGRLNPDPAMTSRVRGIASESGHRAIKGAQPELRKALTLAAAMP